MNKPLNEQQAGKTAGRGRVYDSILDTIGNTPLVRIDKFAKEKAWKPIFWPSWNSSTLLQA
ncbi:hypothetical protein HGG76_02680 [Ochrobactrum tritici]|uniref:Cysteine synthase n=1 Tax=Brucella tritici TaxID=94626 RepID=A0A7X6FNZ5_9HYPH|nr:hypothetical protein [Brucella tritici]